MTHRFDEMRVAPDPLLAEALRQRLHAHMASASWDDHQGLSHLQLDAARLEPEQRLVPVKEIYVSIDSPPTSETRNRRRLAMAAAAVIAVIGVAATAVNIRNSDDDVAPAPAVQPTAAPTTVAPTTVAPTTVAPTTKTFSFPVTSANDIPVTFTAPLNWVVDGGTIAYADNQGGAPGVVFDGITNIYADACQWVLLDPPVGPTVDDLVAAWSNLPDFAATAAVDVTVDGYAGKQFEFSVPDYDGGCKKKAGVGRVYALWDYTGMNKEDAPGYFAWSSNLHLQIWVLDVDGTRLVIGATTLPYTAPQDRAALDEVLASIQIG
jgi:hypothetical protein